jgi:hypothetical protein
MEKSYGEDETYIIRNSGRRYGKSHALDAVKYTTAERQAKMMQEIFGVSRRR